MTDWVTGLLAVIGFLAVTAWAARTSAQLWKEHHRPEAVLVWMVYAGVFGAAYGEHIWETLEPHRWREWLQLLRAVGTIWAVIIALLFLLGLIWYAVDVARGINDDEGLGLGLFGRPVERLVKHLFARRRARRGPIDPRGPKGK